jgi:hypothetical protein
VTTAGDQPAAAERRIEWASQTLTQGEILAGFADHCRNDLDEVEVVEEGPVYLVARWRRETSRIELRERIDGLGPVDPATPTLLVGELGEDLDSLAEAFVSDQALRNALALYDLVRLEKVSAVRSSVFVYFEWFLRDAYGVKLLPAAAFTRRLIDRGLISLGFG